MPFVFLIPGHEINLIQQLLQFVDLLQKLISLPAEHPDLYSSHLRIFFKL